MFLVMAWLYTLGLLHTASLMIFTFTSIRFLEMSSGLILKKNKTNSSNSRLTNDSHFRMERSVN